MSPPHDAAVAWGLAEVAPTPSVVTIGNFDGVHRGHRVLLRRTVDAAHERSVRSVVVTFDPHPAAIVRPGSEPAPLQTRDERVTELAASGVDLVVVLPFDAVLAALGPAEFIEQVLVERLRAERVVVGTNFRFGHKAKGDVVTLVEEGERHGFEVEAVTLFELDDVPVSSTELRSRLAEGDVEWASRGLGRPYRVGGQVVAGDGRGRSIGVPTANLSLPETVVIPAAGVYAGHATVGATTYPCVTNVGTRPTFGDADPVTVEVHLLDATVDLYGARLTVTFEHRLRAERRFEGVEELVAQIRRDIDEARTRLGVPRGDSARGT